MRKSVVLWFSPFTSDRLLYGWEGREASREQNHVLFVSPIGPWTFLRKWLVDLKTMNMNS